MLSNLSYFISYLPDLFLHTIITATTITTLTVIKKMTTATDNETDTAMAMMLVLVDAIRNKHKL